MEPTGEAFSPDGESYLPPQLPFLKTTEVIFPSGSYPRRQRKTQQGITVVYIIALIGPEQGAAGLPGVDHSWLGLNGTGGEWLWLLTALAPWLIIFSF
jgi:hypothetical protein